MSQKGKSDASASHTCGINKFLERDIDLLLAEELRVNPEFCKWIFSRFNNSNQVSYPAVSSNISVVEDGSEADVIANFKSTTGIYRLYIENKIDASLMPDQLERYFRRAKNDVKRGEIKSFSIVLFAPSNYAEIHLPDGVTRIHYEDAALALQSYSPSLRSEYRASLLNKACPLKTAQSRDMYVATVEPYIKDWWDSVYSMLNQEFSGFFLPPRTRYPRSVFFAPQTEGMPNYLRVDFKGHKGEVDLAFKNCPFAPMADFLKNINNVPGRLIANGKSCALRIDGLDPFIISDGKYIIPTKVRACYQAAYILLSFWKMNRGSFDEFVKRFN